MNYDQLIYDIAIKNGFNPSSAKFIAAQARLESSDYNSNVFKNNNNMFGMKYVKQPLAVRGTQVPVNERQSGDVDYNYYAKYRTPEDSVKDLIERLYNKTINGVSPSQLRDSATIDEYAKNLKQRSYYGGTAEKYAAGLKAKMIKINIKEIVNQVTQGAEEYKGSILFGVFVVVIIVALYKFQS